MTATDALPRIDVHTTDIAAPPDAVWHALSTTLDRSFGGPAAARYARLVGCRDHTVSGPRPLAEGSALPGFHVTTADPGRTLALQGAHRFSAYALTFRIEEGAPGRCRLHAETRAAFPGPLGALYRTLVITPGAHARLTRRLLAGVRGRAERIR
ncbi:SRPBCC family protein [Streptomyces sp. NPDC052682]|uniref:SRPBCC family protein n=1 Tax=Streptomyces sp. NPDC052682 TaxID=3154954 RepID=UPI0034171441